VAGCGEYGNEPSGSIKYGEFLRSCRQNWKQVTANLYAVSTSHWRDT
jgi:hypothetical protein